MSSETLSGVTVDTRANVYFDGKCVSHNVTMPDGSRRSVGVVLASELTFGTQAPEIMECVAGACEYRLPGQEAWTACGPGDSFRAPGMSAFEIRVAEAFHYICHYV